MKLALLALALTVSLHADVLTYTSSQTIFADPSGRHVDFLGSVSIPSFDPTLGVLDSISYSFGVAGFLNWAVISVANGGYVEFAINTNASFLGVSEQHNAAGISGGASNANCGPSIPKTCADTTTRLTQLAIEMDGVIGQSASSITNPYWYEYLASTTLVGLPQGQLGDFSIGGTLALPFSLSVDAIGATPYSSPAIGPQALVLGDLSGPQRSVANVNWRYLYTPLPQILAIEVSETPEPGTLLLGALGLALIALGQHIRTLPPRGPVRIITGRPVRL